MNCDKGKILQNGREQAIRDNGCVSHTHLNWALHKNLLHTSHKLNYGENGTAASEAPPLFKGDACRANTVSKAA